MCVPLDQLSQESPCYFPLESFSVLMQEKCVLTMQRESPHRDLCSDTWHCMPHGLLDKQNFLSPLLFSHPCGVAIWAHIVSELTQPGDSGPDTFWNDLRCDGWLSKTITEKVAHPMRMVYPMWQLSLWDAVLIYSRRGCSDNYIKQVKPLLAGQQTSAQNHFTALYQQLSAFIYRAPVTSLWLESWCII